MHTELFDFYLPEELIAKYPTKKRSESLLLSFNKDCIIEHLKFYNIVDLIPNNSLLVFNNTKVIPARIFASKESGGKVEILLERVLINNQFLCHIRSNKKLKNDTILYLGIDKLKNTEYKCKVIGREENLFIIESLFEEDLFTVLDKIGHIPLPPYITRIDEDSDFERYQTVYSKVKGAVAAPTAGLHFDENIMQKLKQKNIKFCFITLHVGSGTFLPVKTDNILEHKMHSEYINVDEESCNLVNDAILNGNKIYAVGTTSVRCLETLANHSLNENGTIKPYNGFTNIFLYPGKNIKIVDYLITNFHLPKSTLIMLISAFIGIDNTMKIYKEAIDKKYRFFSYGDSSIIPNLTKI